MTADRLNVDLAAVADLDAPELSNVWQRHLGGTAPDHLPRSILSRLLAYHLQVQIHGDLSKRALSYLQSIEADLKAERIPETPYLENKQLKPGSQLVREHDGVLHRVMVLKGSFAWDGKIYPSLSAVAKAITGTQWNGNRFFGLKGKAKAATENIR